MVLYDKGKDGDSFVNLADKHWEILNPRRKSDNNYKINESLVSRFKTAISHFQQTGEKNKARFLRHFTNQDNRELKNLIKAPAKSLNIIIRKTERKLKKYGLRHDENFYQYLLDRVFQYKNWRRNGKFEQIFQLLEIPVCPYCNIAEVFQDTSKGIVVTSLDHYYDKASYPYLSLSFFNLIPVCHVCNQTYKGTSSFSLKSHLHPYNDDYNGICFFQSNIFIDNQGPIEIIYNKHRNRAEVFNDDLGIRNRYNQQASLDEAKRIYMLHQTYPDTKKSELINDWGLTKEDVEKRICNENIIPYSNDLIRFKVRGKLKRDLAIRCGIISENI